MPRGVCGSAAREVQPVGAIETRIFEQAPGPLTRAAQDAFWDEVKATTGVDRHKKRACHWPQ